MKKERICKNCGKKFTPKHPSQLFCSNYKTKGRNNCKDNYWNAVRDPSDARKDYLDTYYDRYEEHPFSTEALGQW